MGGLNISEAVPSAASHYAADRAIVSNFRAWLVEQFQYTFQNYFHPFVGELIGRLNTTSVAGLLDPKFLQGLKANLFGPNYQATDSTTVQVHAPTSEIDVAPSGPYSVYNWELLYHIPVAIAVHLSKNQRFAEAQKWFHLVYDPTCADATIPTPLRYWRCFAFWQQTGLQNIDDLLALLSTPDAGLSPDQIKTKKMVLEGYEAIRQEPFKPHVVARTRPVAYQFYVVMKYLDNLIAWGDHLFAQYTVETINEATLCYVLAWRHLGPRAEQMPALGTVGAKNFRQLKQAGLDAMGNAMVDLESRFPFNTAAPAGGDGEAVQTGPLFGVGRTLYFCVPPNQTLLSYWDTVADRLFKIRHCMDITGVVRPLPLFDPPIDPGMLVKAAAAGIDVGSIVSGLNQPLGPVRSLTLIQKALEIAGEVRALGGALLSALEKGDAEQLALLRQGHEAAVQQMTQDVRFLQWQQARESTNTLLRTRSTMLERYKYYLRLLGQAPDPKTVPDTFALDRRELTEDNFDDAFAALVGQFDSAVALQTY
ncbi:MAG TPA: hypothetical protein VFW33_14560, partial [Gemmataceae bacterium]|nr:hypothetical protein [Gemmataceae bacterium]